MTRRFTLLVVVAGLLAVPGAARAQDAVTAQGIETHATFRNVGVVVTITGDANRNATAALEVNLAGAGFRPAHRLSRVGADRFIGSALMVPPATAYTVRVTLTDPEGVSGSPLEASGTTRDEAVPVSSGQSIHVSPDGDDDLGDGSAGAPYRTLARGADDAQPGDAVLLHAGTYHEEVNLPRGGTPGAPLTIAAFGDGPAVLDGADPTLRDGAAWTDEGGNVWSAPTAATGYVSVDGQRLWRYETLTDLEVNALGTDGGFFADGSRVYVRLPADAAPAGHDLQVSVLGRALWLEGTPDVVIQGLVIRCFGSEEYSQGVMVRDGSHRVWIVDTTFENVMPGVWVKNEVDDLTITGCTFSDRGLTEFPWYEVKSRGGMESGAIALDQAYDGQGIVFAHNWVHDSFDGLHLCGDTPGARPNHADVIGNLVQHMGDDGMETDGTCVNVRILGNRFEDVLCGVSVAPAVGGPTYIVRNQMVGLRNVSPDTDWMTRAVKLNVGDDRPSGEVFVYHNTAETHEAEQSAFGVTDDSIWESLVLRNNVWVGTGYPFYYVNAGSEPFSQDYDLIFATAGDRWVSFQGERYDTVDAYLGATGLCAHCVAGDPRFLDAAGGDYALDEGSPALDVGEVIPGVNDDYQGAGPDLGALERGGDVPVLPDGGVLPDARPPVDAGQRPDGGGGDGTGGDGCGCATTDGGASPLILALLVLVLLRRRRSSR